jgi:hypothetical protein
MSQNSNDYGSVELLSKEEILAALYSRRMEKVQTKYIIRELGVVMGEERPNIARADMLLKWLCDDASYTNWERRLFQSGIGLDGVEGWYETGEKYPGNHEWLKQEAERNR